MLTYFLQVNVCWLLFYAAYYALLSRETFFKLNRIYLIISLLCGLVIPLSIFYLRMENTAVIVLKPFVVSANVFQAGVSQVSAWQMWEVLGGLYVLGATMIGGHFLMGLLKIRRIYQQGEKVVSDGFSVVYTEGVLAPFSFFNFIFINPYLYESVDFECIMKHEKTHVLQKHSYDVVFLEVLTIVFWFSPLVYFYKKALRNVHEFLADEAVLQTASTPYYGRLLLKQAQPQYAVALVNPFFSQLKKRILMMSKNRSSKKALLKYALFVPVLLAVATFVWACSQNAKGDAIEKQADVAPQFQGGQQAMFKFLGENIQYPREAADANVSGTTYLNLVIEKDGSISNVNVKKTAELPTTDTITMIDPKTYQTTIKVVQSNRGDLLDKEAMRVVKAMPKWIPAQKDGQAVRNELILPIKFEIDNSPTQTEQVDTIMQIDPKTLKTTTRIVKRTN